MSAGSEFAVWFAREGWLYAFAGVAAIVLVFVALAIWLPVPGDDDEWGGGSF